MIKCSGFRTKILAQKTKKKKKINHEKLDFMQRDLPFRKIKKIVIALCFTLHTDIFN